MSHVIEPGMIDSATGRRLAGDWRRPKTKRTDAHLYQYGAVLPLCGLRLQRRDTDAVPLGYACTPCLTADIARRRAG